MKIIPSKNIINDAKNGGLTGAGISIALNLISNGFSINPAFWVSSIVFGFFVGFLITGGNVIVINAFLKVFPNYNKPLFPLLLIIYIVSVAVFYVFTSLCNLFFLLISPQEIFYVSLGVGVSCIIATLYFLYAEEKEELLRLEKENRRLAVIEERNRIARELHDSVSQNLFGINLNLNNLNYVLSDGPEKAQEITNLTLEMVEEVQQDMRLMIYELKPNILSEKGFIEAIRNLVNLFQIRYNLKISCLITGSEELLDDQKQLAFYRVIQEVLNNVVKHAEATNVNIDIKLQKNTGILRVRDNGKGFIPTEIIRDDHLGLKGIKERVEQLKGEFRIQSIPGKGTMVIIKL